jgi:hypothetical protein
MAKVGDLTQKPAVWQVLVGEKHHFWGIFSPSHPNQ